MLKDLVKRILPGPLVQELVTLREFVTDFWRYRRSTSERSPSMANRSGERLEAAITVDYHRIEKGLALPAPKRPFGRYVEASLLALMQKCDAHERAKPYFGYARDAVQGLALWNGAGVVDSTICPTGQDSAEFSGIDAATLGSFFATRRSVRHFEHSRVPSTEIVREAVRLARHSPSVCNRQAFRLHIYSDPGDVARVLAQQNGNAGFAHTIPMVGVVTVRRSLFFGPEERNQRWIDGGLFAMSLVWALHGLGLKTCMLNWAMKNGASDLLRTCAGIDADEDVVVLVAIGYAAQGYRVARSERRSVSEIVRFH